MTLTNDSRPKTLYVSRKVINTGDIVSWAREQGFKSILPADDMHVTVAFSRKPIDWMKISESWQGKVELPEGGPRAMEEFGGGAKVLQFRASELLWRHEDIKDAGASWDHEEYQPHITITYGDMPDGVEPYQGKIVLGPEIFQEVNEGWASNVREYTLRDGDTAGINRVMNTRFTDYAPVTRYETHKDGYLVVYADRVARTGVQEYGAWESDDLMDIAKRVGKTEKDTIKIYRDPDEVFSDSAVNGWAHVPVTVNHPPELLGPDNYKDYAVGEVSTSATISEDRKWFGLQFIVKDAPTIKDTQSGKYPETSGGYTAEIEIGSGVSPDGEFYDARQVGINPNHLAMVQNGRAFSDAANNGGDKWGVSPITKEEVKMTDMKTVVIGDKAVQVAANDADTITKMIADHKAEIEAKDEAIGTLKASLADAESKVLSDEDLDKKVKELADAKSNREKAKGLWGDEAVEGASDAEISGMLKVADQAKPADDKMRKALGDAKTQNANAWADIIKTKESK